MKYLIEDKDSFDALEETQQSLYAERDGAYVLQIEGLPEMEDVSGLKNQVQTLLDEKKKATQKAREAQESAERARLDAAAKNGDVEALNQSWQQKLDQTKSSLETENSALIDSIKKLTTGSQAINLATELAVKGSGDLLLPHIESRLRTEISDGVAKTVVLDRAGNPSALTVDELKQEFRSNPAFERIIAGSNAGGAGHQPNTNDGGGSSVKTITRDQFNALNDVQRRSFAIEGGKIVNA